MSTLRSGKSRASVVCMALNPALDQTIEVSGLRQGEVNRAQRAQVDVGGKGINVASCLADFGVGVAVTGQLGRNNAVMFESLFADKQIGNYCLYLDGLTRINTKVVDPASGQTTDINMPGPQLTPEEISGQIDKLFSVLDELALSVRWVVLSGSLPPGWPTDTYGQLTRHAKSRGAKVLLDASGPAFEAGLAAGPQIVKPNRDELAEVVGSPLTTLEETASVARKLLEQQPELELVAVSMGSEGALFVSRNEALHAHPLKVDLISSVGAGDAMVAGIVAARLEALPLEGCAQLATAFSAAKLTRLGPHLPGQERVRELATQVHVTPLG